jgi:FKBP-type peptidyl-prolyl cis-trans isomerase FkpA
MTFHYAYPLNQQIHSQTNYYYTGTLVDGTVFDSSVERGATIKFKLGQVIKGWQEGLAMMKEGGKATLVIPPELAYGDMGSGGAVPPGATLKFEVELFKVNP